MYILFFLSNRVGALGPIALDLWSRGSSKNLFLNERILIVSTVLYGWDVQAVLKTFLPHCGHACA